MQTTRSNQRYPEHAMPITSWSEEDRPREKLMARGKNSLSDAELLAILLGSGTKNESAVALAQRILTTNKNNLHQLGKCSTLELKKFRGIGEAKAITIVAALELGKRRQLSNKIEQAKIVSSKDAYNLLAPSIMDLPHEEFWLLFLNRGNKVLGRQMVSIGGTSATIVDVKIVFKKTIEAQASSIILCHNHPSGNTYPSKADIALTKRLVEGGRLLDIAVLDHLIISENGYYSFADEGEI